jgi:LysM repeat protein
MEGRNMSTHRVVAGDTLSKIARDHGLELNELLALNPEYKANPNDIDVGDVVQLSSRTRTSEAGARKKKKKAKARKAQRRARPTPVAAATGGNFQVPRGQVTFDAEGMEGGPFHSRRLHVPGPTSGATIGRGYDMGQRSQDEIVSDLTAAGLGEEDAKSLARLRGFTGHAAESEIARLGLDDFEINPRQQKLLFLIAYDELAGDVKRICRKHDVEVKYGVTDWQALHPRIRDIVVDLRYRGDYTGATRERVQPCVVANDLARLRTLMANRRYWVQQRGVPNDRFRRRSEYLS